MYSETDLLDFEYRALYSLLEILSTEVWRASGAKIFVIFALSTSLEIETSSLVLRISKTLLLTSSCKGEFFFPFFSGGMDESREGFSDLKIKETFLGVFISKHSNCFCVFEWLIHDLNSDGENINIYIKYC